MLRRAAALVVAAAMVSGCGDGGGRITKAATASTTDAVTTTAAEVVDATPGAPDVGDPIVPGAGNGGYDVRHYDLDLQVSDDRGTITASTTIESEATQDLSAFNLDLAGLTVESVTVDGDPATVDRSDDELTITPSSAIADGAEFTTVVRYSGSPQPVQDPSAPGTIGWLSAPSGTYVAGEATGAKGYFPCSDHPGDKATFTITVTAIDSDTVIANGTLSSKEPAGAGHTRWTFDQTDTMATYLVQIAVGDYDLIESTGPHGLPIRHAVVRSVTDEQRAILDDTAAQIEYFEGLFGTFPLDNYGLLVADSRPEFALETQTLTLLPSEWLTSDDTATTGVVMAHELAHQWFGDAVSPERWSDIWLNEGFATYGEWLWADHAGITPLAESVDDAMAQAPRWREAFGPVAEPTAPVLFSPNEYGGAGVVLHALRRTVGDDTFFTILRGWLAEHGGGSATTDDFEAVASRVARRDLDQFFDDWLRSSTLPSMPG